MSTPRPGPSAPRVFHRMPAVCTLGEWRRASAKLLAAGGIESAPVEADLIARHVLAVTRETLFTDRDRKLRPADKRRLSRFLHNRLRRIPLQYLVGEVDFRGLTVKVNPSVLIPRPETEGLVELALGLVSDEDPAWVLDVGTGSGCVALALASARPRARVWGTELSRPALQTAVANAARLGLSDRVRFLLGDLVGPVWNSGWRDGVQEDGPSPEQRFGLVVSNPPYVAEAERALLPPEVVDHEPGVALFAPEDGLGLIRRLIPEAHAVLAPEGWLVLEIGETQGDAVLREFSKAGNAWTDARVEHDLAGRVRYALARRT